MYRIVERKEILVFPQAMIVIKNYQKIQLVDDKSLENALINCYFVLNIALLYS